MCLRPDSIQPVPEDTTRVAQAAFAGGNPYLTMRDEFAVFFADPDFASLFPNCGQPAEAPWRLALVSILQFAEGLSDRQAADAVRSRIDWKYLLGLELTDPGFDACVLCEFRSRLVAGGSERLLFDALLGRFRERRLLKARGRQRSDSTHVLAAIRAMNRLEGVGETLRHALNVLATVAPDWLREQCPEAWAERYARRFEDERLPKSEAERAVLARSIGGDGFYLLERVYLEGAPLWLREVPAVQVLRRVWVQQYYREPDPRGEGMRVQWRSNEDIPPASLFIGSPYDPEAHYSKKRSTRWVGYKVHLTETCDPDTPHLVTDIQTTPGPTPDGEMTAAIQEALNGRGLLPEQHVVDASYVDAELLLSGREQYGVDLVGPTRPDSGWQARQAEGFAASDFVIKWEERYAVCPQGKRSAKWRDGVDRWGNDVVKIDFARADCGGCPCRQQCTRARSGGRMMVMRTQQAHHALQAARQREMTEEFRRAYAARAGIEGTLSQGVRRCGMRRCRYIGESKTRLQHLLTASALNFIRVAEWLTGTPLARTRTSTFCRLMAARA